LNQEGVWQSRQLAARLRDLSIGKVYASDLRRARETAQIVFAKAPIEPAADWREMNFGAFEGLTHEQLLERYPVLYRDWVDDPARVQPPGGERLGDLCARVREKMAALLSQHAGQTVAVVTHGGPIRVLLCDALQLDVSGFRQIRQECGAWNAVDYVQGAPPQVTVMNDVSHLTARKAGV
jgi:broad specificity phosphatase PhoE